MKAMLRSNDGRKGLQIDLGGSRNLKGEAGFTSKFEFETLNWPNLGDAGGPYPCQLGVAGLWLPIRALSELHTVIAEWLALPLEKLAITELSGDFELAGRHRQSLRLKFGERDGIIADRHQVVSVAVVAAFFQADFCFVTDQSCLQQFAAELGAAIADNP